MDQHFKKIINELQARVEVLEQESQESNKKNNEFKKLMEGEINDLKRALKEMRESAIRAEIASGKKTKDVAKKFNVTPARITQIAPRRKYNNG